MEGEGPAECRSCTYGERLDGNPVEAVPEVKGWREKAL